MQYHEIEIYLAQVSYISVHEMLRRIACIEYDQTIQRILLHDLIDWSFSQEVSATGKEDEIKAFLIEDVLNSRDHFNDRVIPEYGGCQWNEQPNGVRLA
jgi:hypothetical protein